MRVKRAKKIDMVGTNGLIWGGGRIRCPLGGGQWSERGASLVTAGNPVSNSRPLVLCLSCLRVKTKSTSSLIDLHLRLTLYELV